VNIGYVPSYKKPKPAPKLLDDEEAWDLLVADVGQHIKGTKSKNREKGEVQPFSLLIVDMSEEPSKGPSVAAGKKVREGCLAVVSTHRDTGGEEIEDKCCN
jgi:hypothetical protein